jgi:hypothetical protein
MINVFEELSGSFFKVGELLATSLLLFSTDYVGSKFLRNVRELLATRQHSSFPPM